MKYRHFKTRSNFDLELEQGLISSTDICFIKDTGELWTHNRFYGITEEALEMLRSATTAISDHSSSTTNPHQVTKEQVGLGNVDNTSDSEKRVLFAESASDVASQSPVRATGSWIYRTTPVTEDGYIKLDKVTKVSDTWNQLITKGDPVTGLLGGWTVSGSAYGTLDEGYIRAFAYGSGYFGILHGIQVEKNHKYLGILSVRSSDTMKVTVTTGETVDNQEIDSSWKTFSSLLTATSTTVLSFGVSSTGAASNVGESVWVKDAQLFDLTKIFGEGLEPETLEDFRKFYPDQYYEYAINVPCTTICYVSIGTNLMEESFEAGDLSRTTGEPSENPGRLRSTSFNPVISGSTLYYNTETPGKILFYTSTTELVSAVNMTDSGQTIVPVGSTKFKVTLSGRTYTGGTIISVLPDQDYRPYIKHVYFQDLTKLKSNGTFVFPGGLEKGDSLEFSGYAVKGTTKYLLDNYTRPVIPIQPGGIEIYDAGSVPGVFEYTEYHGLVGKLETYPDLLDILTQDTVSDWSETDPTSGSYIKNKPDVLLKSDISEWAKSDRKPSYTPSEIGAASTEDLRTVRQSIETLNSDGTVTGSIVNKINEALNKFAGEVSNDGVINTFKELVDYAATHQTEYSNLAAILGDIPIGEDNQPVAPTLSDYIHQSVVALSDIIKGIQGEGIGSIEYPVILMPEEGLDALRPEQALEGVFYYGYEEATETGPWHFGDKFPIVFS